MADQTLYIRDANGNLVPVDVRTLPDGDRRQVVVLGDGENAGLVSPATEDTLTAILTELTQKLESGGIVALDAATLSALEQVTVTPTAAGDVAAALTPGRKTVTTVGTPVAIATSMPCKWVQVTALKTNTQQVNTGGTGVSATAGSSTGDPLGPGESITYPIDDASKIFVDTRVAGEGVSFTVGS